MCVVIEFVFICVMFGLTSRCAGTLHILVRFYWEWLKTYASVIFILVNMWIKPSLKKKTFDKLALIQCKSKKNDHPTNKTVPRKWNCEVTRTFQSTTQFHRNETVKPQGLSNQQHSSREMKMWSYNEWSIHHVNW